MLIVRENRPIIELPRIIDIRSNAIDHIVDTLKTMKIKGRAMIVVDENTKKIAGDRVSEQLENNHENIMEIITSASVAEAERMKKIYEEKKIDFVIGVGGGTVIDVAKYSSYLTSIPFVSVPTVASHDGIASARASLLGTNKKHSFQAHSPIAVIGDVETIAKAPPRFAISGSADLLSNMTAVLDWELSNRITGEHISQYAVALSEMTAQTIINNCDIITKDPIQGTYIVLKGLITSSMAMCIAGSSRPASGAEHMISHVLDENTNTKALHGEQCGIASIITMYLHGGNWMELTNTLSTLKAPLSLNQLGITHEELIDAVINAQSIRKNRYTILSGGISRKAAENAITFTNIE